MGKRHNTLNDTIFRNSRYMEVVNKQVGCKDFRKEYKEQYDFMLDTFSTLILLNNCFFSDSNLALTDKVEMAQKIIGKYLYLDFNEDTNETESENGKNKYSVRFIQGIIEKYSTHLYRRINEWYFDYLNNTTSNVTNIDRVLEDIETEMTRLENVCFDNMVKKDIDYKKNKDSNYKIYISKFDTLYTDREPFLEAYKNDFNELYGIDLTDDELSTMANFYTLLAKANNGIVNVISNTEVKDYGLNANSTPNDYYNAYLDTLHIKPRSRDKLEAQQFMLFFLLNYAQHLKPKGFTINEVINNYDSFHFLIVMEELLKDDTFKPTNDIANGLYKNLKCVYELMSKKVSSPNELMENYKKAYEEITKIINRHIDYFVRLS